MLQEQKELYNYTTNHFENELSKISKSCISPIIEIRKVVKKSMLQYIKDYCNNVTKIEDIFSEDDFKQVSEKIYNNIMEG